MKRFAAASVAAILLASPALAGGCDSAGVRADSDTLKAQRRAFDEAIAAKDLSAMAAALAQYGRTNSLWGYVEGRSRAATDVNSALVRALMLRPEIMMSGEPPEELVEAFDYDWAKLKESRSALSLVIVNYVAALDRRRKDLAAVRQVLAALGAAL